MILHGPHQSAIEIDHDRHRRIRGDLIELASDIAIGPVEQDGFATLAAFGMLANAEQVHAIGVSQNGQATVAVCALAMITTSPPANAEGIGTRLM